MRHEVRGAALSEFPSCSANSSTSFGKSHHPGTAPSLPDTEPREDLVEYVFVGDLAGDGTEFFECHAEI